MLDAADVPLPKTPGVKPGPSTPSEWNGKLRPSPNPPCRLKHLTRPKSSCEPRYSAMTVWAERAANLRDHPWSLARRAWGREKQVFENAARMPSAGVIGVFY
jgi:hypothetical protein